MNRFYALPDNIDGDIIWLDPSNSYHLIKVLRLSCGDRVMVFDGQGNEYVCEIIETGSDCVKLRILERRMSPNEAGTNITLIQSIPKFDKMDLIVQKCTELGVARIVPVISGRTIVKLSPEAQESRRQRWQRIAGEAAKQCGRSIIPEIANVTSFRSALDIFTPNTLALIPWECEKTITIGSVLKQSKAEAVSVCIGPEGGFSADEVDMAVQSRVIPVSLGPRILRTETAGLVALTIILYEFGEI